MIHKNEVRPQALQLRNSETREPQTNQVPTDVE